MTKFKVGDIIYTPNGDHYSVSKILAVDFNEMKRNPFLLYHVLLYKSVPSLPKAEDIADFQVLLMHAPISTDGVDKDSRLICNRPVTKDELEGYYAFLRRTDFNLFLNVTGQDLETIVDQAIQHLDDGRAAHKEMMLEQAIEHYTLAHETLPVLSLAFAHKGFAYMDLGRFEEALEALEESLQIDQDEKAVWCSIGECLLALGKPKAALPYFETGAKRWPEETIFHNLLAKAKALIV